MAEEVDEFGIPIKKQPVQEVDEFGIPIKKKEPTQSQKPSPSVPKYLSTSTEGYSGSTTTSGSEAPSTSSEWTPLTDKVKETKKGVKFDLTDFGMKMYGDNAVNVYNKAVNPQSPYSANKSQGESDYVGISTDGDFIASKTIDLGNGQSATQETVVQDDFADKAGIDYWTATGRRNSELGQATGLMKIKGDKPRVVPLETKKVVDDYIAYLRENDNKKFTQLYSRTKSDNMGMDFAPGEEINLLKEAFDYQRRLVDGQYLQDKKNGKIVDDNGMKIEDKYRLAYQEIGKTENYILTQNGDYDNLRYISKWKQQREIERQKIVDDAYKKMSEESPTLAYIKYGIVQPIAQSITRNEYALFDLFTETDPEAMSQLYSNLNAATPTQLKGDIWGEDGFNFSTFTAKTSGMLTDMVGLLGGAKGLNAFGASYKPALLASSYVTTYNGYYTEAYQGLRDLGYTKEQADKIANEHATASSALTSALELISPNTSITIPPQVTKQVVKNVAKGESFKSAFGGAVKGVFNELKQEIPQELSQTIGDKMVAANTNSRYQFDVMNENITGNEIFETILLTGVATGAVTLARQGQLSEIQKSSIYASANNFEDFEKHLNDMVANDEISKDDAKVARTQVEGVKRAIDGIPQSVKKKLNDRQIADVAILTWQKKQEEEKASKAIVDPQFAEKKQKEFDAKIEEYNKEINDVLEQSKEMGKQSAEEGKKASDEYSKQVVSLASRMNKEDFVDYMMENDFDGEIDEKEARKFYSKQYDKANKTRLPSEVGKREELIQAESEQGTGGEASEAGGVFQAQESKAVINPDVFSIFEEQKNAKSNVKSEALNSKLAEIATQEEIEDAKAVNDNFDAIIKQMIDNGDLIQDCEL